MTREPRADDSTLPLVSSESEEPSFSRPTDTSPFGKCDRSIDVPIPEALKDLLTKLATAEDKALATYVRKVLEDHALREEKRVARILAAFGCDKNQRNAG